MIAEARQGRAIPLVAVLLATRNGRQWLPAQVDSILAQQCVCVSLAVADDASTDETWPWLQERLGLRADVALIRHPQPSGSAGANFRKLFTEAPLGDADYVALADQDDEWAPQKLRRAIESLRASGASGYSSTVLAFWPDGRTQALTQATQVRAADFLFEGGGQGCTFVLAREFFDEVRRFCLAHPAEVERLHYHDWLVYMLSRAWNRGWVFDPETAIRYRQHASNEIGARSGWHAVERRFAQIRNGWYRREVLAACDLYVLAGGRDPRAIALAARLRHGASGNWWRRARLAAALLVSGRRRLVDRGVLAFAALAGWL